MGTGLILAGNFNTPCYINSPSNLKIRKTIKLKYITDQVDLIDICRIFYPTGKEYTFFSWHMEPFPILFLSEVTKKL